MALQLGSATAAPNAGLSQKGTSFQAWSGLKRSVASFTSSGSSSSSSVNSRSLRASFTSSRRARERLSARASQQTFTSFDDVISSADVVLVEFYATWCGPCKIMANVLKDVSKQLGDRVRIVKIDTDKYPNLATEYAIAGLPTMMLYKNGKQLDRLEGAIAAKKLVSRIDSVLAAATST